MWWSILPQLTQERDVIMWDNRGLFDSGPPATDRLDAAAHADDALAALEAFGCDEAHVLAWSSGGRIAIELAWRDAERVISLALVCAGYGRSLGQLLRLELGALLPRAAGIAKYVSKPLQIGLRHVLERPEIRGLVRQSGLTSATADTGALVGLLRELADADPRILLASYEAVSGDPAPELLPAIGAPTLLIAGEHDQFTSIETTREMRRSIPDAELHVYEDATHYLPIEEPARLGSDLTRFFADVERRAG